MIKIKKILIILLPLLLTGCYDFHELDQLAIINTIAIDYDDKYYHLTLEVIDDQKSKEDDSTKEKVYYIESSGKTLSEAFYNAEIKIDKYPFYHHVELLVLGKTTTEEHFSDIIDFFLRDPFISNSIYLIESNDLLAKEIIKKESKSNPFGSKVIKGLITNTLNNNATKETYFQQLTNKYIEYGIDTFIPCLHYDDSDFYFDDIAVFSGNKVNYINSEQIKIFNILNNNITNLTYHEDDNTVIFFDGKTDITIKDDTIIFNIRLNGSLDEYNGSKDLTSHNGITDINHNYEKKLKPLIINYLNYMQTINSDILGINQKYYQTKREKKSFFNTAKIDVNIKVTIEKIGLIYEVNE